MDGKRNQPEINTSQELNQAKCSRALLAIYIQFYISNQKVFTIALTHLVNTKCYKTFFIALGFALNAHLLGIFASLYCMRIGASSKLLDILKRLPSTKCKLLSSWTLKAVSFQAAQAMATDLQVPSNKIFVQGGSHGGFLTLHLVGQFPDFYAAGGVRNPVCNISTMVSATDITDWCFYEGGLPFSYEKTMTPESSQKLLECSPIRYVKEVKSPLLFMIGSSDLRVPPSQSHEYIHALQGLGKEVRVLKYDNNNHPISKVDAEADCFMNFALWFHNH